MKVIYDDETIRIIDFVHGIGIIGVLENKTNDRIIVYDALSQDVYDLDSKECMPVFASDAGHHFIENVANGCFHHGYTEMKTKLKDENGQDYSGMICDYFSSFTNEDKLNYYRECIEREA